MNLHQRVVIAVCSVCLATVLYLYIGRHAIALDTGYATTTDLLVGAAAPIVLLGVAGYVMFASPKAGK